MNNLRRNRSIAQSHCGVVSKRVHFYTTVIDTSHAIADGPWNSSAHAVRCPIPVASPFAFLMFLLGQRKRMHAATFAIDGIPRSDQQHLSDRSGCRIYRPWHTESSEQRSTPCVVSL